jgi:hypothetical protein
MPTRRRRVRPPMPTTNPTDGRPAAAPAAAELPSRPLTPPAPAAPNGTARSEKAGLALPLRWELVAWLLVAGLAIGLRLLNLDGAPLQPAEATLALDSWRLVQHTDVSPAATGVVLGSAPLLVYLNAFWFLLLGSTDAVARGTSMAAGVLVVLSPALLRRTIGRTGALVAAVALATSPTLVFASRTVAPTSLVLALGWGLVLLVAAFGQTRQARYLYGAAALVPLLLMAGPAAYLLVVAALSFAAWVWWAWGRRVTRPAGTLGLVAPPATWLPAPPAGEPWRLSPVLARGAGLAFGVTAVVVATGLGTNLDGLGVALSAPLGAWATSLQGLSLPAAWLFPAILIGYELLVLVFGVVGAVAAIRRASFFGVFLAWWAVVALVLLLLSDGQHPLWSALVVLPLGLLTGAAVDHLPTVYRDAPSRQRLAVIAAVVLPLVATTMIAMGNVTLPQPNVPVWVGAVPPLAIVTFVAYALLWYDWATVRSAVTVLALFCLLLFDIHASMRLSPGGPLNPAELFTGTATSPDVAALTRDVSLVVDELQIDQQINGMPVTDDVEVAAPYADPLAWYLHRLPTVRVVDAVTDAPAIAIVGASAPAPRGPYAGQLFQFSRNAPPPSLTFGGLWRWWIYHETGSGTDTYVKVYVKTQAASP